MKRNPMIEKLEQGKNSLVKCLAIAVVVPLIAGSVIAWGVNNYFEKQKKEVTDAFAGNCGYRIVNLYNYGYYKGKPNTIARDQFEQLREQFPERFEKISNDEGVSQLIKNNYDPKQEEFNIPKYDCE